MFEKSVGVLSAVAWPYVDFKKVSYNFLTLKFFVTKNKCVLDNFGVTIILVNG